MKVAHAEQHVLGSHGLSETKAFNIRTNAHAFKLLSSGLYSDKIAAVLREIGCNAFDAHVEGGALNLPIIVKLPNRIDNQFYIRDMGPGLSHEDVMNLYTTYFASTKQDSNDYTGAFGLGSKSPFSYTDSFSVVSVHGGIKRTYSAYLDNKGSPTISKLVESPADTDWPHGVQIGFPVKQEDFSSFQSKAQSIYQWFKVTPKIEGATAVQKAPVKFDHPLFSVNPGANTGIVMGNVRYPLNIAALGHSGLGTYAPKFPGITLKVNIGEASVTASREQIEYDPATTDFLRKRINEVMGFIANEVATKLREAKTWEQKCNIRGTNTIWEMNNSYGNDWADFFRSAGIQDGVHLAGLLRQDRVPLPHSMGDVAYARVITPSRRGNGINASEVKNGRDGFWHQANPGAIKVWHPGNSVMLNLYTDTLVIYGDHRLSATKVKGLFDSGGARQILLFTTKKDHPATVSQCRTEALAVAQELGIAKVANLDAVPLPASYINRPKKVAKKKGALPPPLPSQRVAGFEVGTGHVTLDISTLKPTYQSFMVKSSGTGYGRQDEIRVFETSADKDRMFAIKDWDMLWNNAAIIANIVQAPFKGFVMLPAVDVRKLDLLKRGWPTTYDLIKSWLTQQTTRDAITLAAQAWQPSVDLGYANFNTWPMGLISVRHNSPSDYAVIEGHLIKHGLSKPIELIYAASVKFKGQGRTEPKILEAYRYMSTVYNLPAITVQKTGGYISIEDFENDVKTKYPLTQTIQFAHFKQILSEHPHKAEGFLKLIIS